MPRPAPLLAKQDSLSGNTMRNFENELAALAPVSGCAPRRHMSFPSGGVHCEPLRHCVQG
eukprot:scaffold303392_cov27-Tisochrysis_lutea.AAC.1